MTNYERIKNMSVEELARFMMDVDYIGECPLSKEGCNSRSCNECIKQFAQKMLSQKNCSNFQKRGKKQ